MAKIKLELNHIKQLRDDDSGIACARMVIDFVRNKLGLEPLASDYATFLSEVTNNKMSADTYINIAKLINHYLGQDLYSAEDIDGVLSIKESLDNSFPVVIGVGDDKNAHAVVIFEYSDNNPKDKEDTFKILDPMCTKQELESGKATSFLMTHKISYAEIEAKKKGGFILQGMAISR